MKKKEAVDALVGVVHELDGVRNAIMFDLNGGDVEVDLGEYVTGAELALGWAALLLKGEVEDEGPRGNLTVLMSAIARAVAEGTEGEGDGDE